MKQHLNDIVHSNCLDLLKDFPDSCVDLVIADPPFNTGYEYNTYKDKLKYNEYVDWSKSWISECYRVLKDSGSIFIIIGDEYCAELTIILKELKMNFRNKIIWHYTFGPHQETKFGRRHQNILYFSKNKKPIFNSDDIRIESQRQKLGDKRANPKGMVPGDVWEFPRICGNYKTRIKGHPCQTPLGIMERIIKVATKEGDLVFDPFSGSGSVARACKDLKRNFIACDIDGQYIKIGKERLKQ